MLTSVRREKVPGSCAWAGCEKPRSSDGSPRADHYCRAHRAEASAKYYERHHRERNNRRRTRSVYRDDATRAADSARSKVSGAISRGTIAKGSCVRCRSADVTALIIDPDKWREVIWVCRDHRADEIASHAPPPADPAATWQAERARALAEIADLPEAEQARLRAIAARGPAGISLTPEAPLFTIRMVNLYKTRQVTA